MSNQLSRRQFLTSAFAISATHLTRTNLSPQHAVIYHGPRYLNKVALTIDDCFSYEHTVRYEALLDANPTIKATFYPAGTGMLLTAKEDPDLWPRLVRKGHEIAYHTYDHQAPSDLSLEEFRLDWQYWQRAYELTVGEKPRNIRFARPPYGDMSDSFLALCAEVGLIVTMWTSSWGFEGEQGQALIDNVRRGDIILLHTRTHDIENLTDAIPQLKVRNLELVTMFDMFRTSIWPTQSPNAQRLGRFLNPTDD